MSFTVVIPARYASTRLPGKMLLSLAGKPVIQHVYERACQSGAEQVIIATDHEDIVDAVQKFSGNVVLTSASHQSGTERIAEVVEQLGFENEKTIVNVQGDEPLIEPAIIKSVAANLAANRQASIATVATLVTQSADFFNPNVVKVVLDSESCALYFSRAPIPWPRDPYMGKPFAELVNGEFPQLVVPVYRHVGLYAYSAGFVKTYVGLPPSPLEKTEALEQLRALSSGYRISVHVTDGSTGIGIDTREDYDRVKEIVERC